MFKSCVPVLLVSTALSEYIQQNIYFQLMQPKLVHVVSMSSHCKNDYTHYMHVICGSSYVLKNHNYRSIPGLSSIPTIS